MSTDLTKLLAEHVGLTYDSGRAWCTCGKLLWTAREGFTAGELIMTPGKSVGEIAHTHHLASVIEAAVRDEVIDAEQTGFGDGIDWARETLDEEDRANANASLVHAEQARADDAEAERDRLRAGIKALADAWTRGQWADVMLPKSIPPAVPVIDYSNRVGDWLRDRANEIEGA